MKRKWFGINLLTHIHAEIPFCMRKKKKRSEVRKTNDNIVDVDNEGNSDEDEKKNAKCNEIMLHHIAFDLQQTLCTLIYFIYV